MDGFLWVISTRRASSPAPTQERSGGKQEQRRRSRFWNNYPFPEPQIKALLVRDAVEKQLNQR
jgi:hypothetical protein